MTKNRCPKINKTFLSRVLLRLKVENYLKCGSTVARLLDGDSVSPDEKGGEHTLHLDGFRVVSYLLLNRCNSVHFRTTFLCFVKNNM